MSTPGNKGDTTMARAVCDGRYYYIANLIQARVDLPVEQALAVGTGHGEYGDPGPQYSIDLHDETVLQKDKQPLPYELLRQLCMSDAPPEEFYDLNADPWAVKNLVNDPAYTKPLAMLREEMKAWRQASGDHDIHPKQIPMRGKK